jgi:hypothetical protein
VPLRHRPLLTPALARAESDADLTARLLLARSLVVFGRNPKTRSQAMQAVNLLRDELARRGVLA